MAAHRSIGERLGLGDQRLLGLRDLAELLVLDGAVALHLVVDRVADLLELIPQLLLAALRHRADFLPQRLERAEPVAEIRRSPAPRAISLAVAISASAFGTFSKRSQSSASRSSLALIDELAARARVALAERVALRRPATLPICSNALRGLLEQAIDSRVRRGCLGELLHVLAHRRQARRDRDAALGVFLPRASRSACSAARRASSSALRFSRSSRRAVPRPRAPRRVASSSSGLHGASSALARHAGSPRAPRARRRAARQESRGLVVDLLALPEPLGGLREPLVAIVGRSFIQSSSARPAIFGAPCRSRSCRPSPRSRGSAAPSRRAGA